MKTLVKMIKIILVFMTGMLTGAIAFSTGLAYLEEECDHWTSKTYRNAFK